MGLWRKADSQSKPIPAHPYRDSALVYGCFALLVVVLSWATGGDVTRALVVAAGFWVVATGWASWQFRVRIKARDAAADKADVSE